MGKHSNFFFDTKISEMKVLVLLALMVYTKKISRVKPTWYGAICTFFIILLTISLFRADLSKLANDVKETFEIEFKSFGKESTFPKKTVK
jgi:hypothetical protein